MTQHLNALSILPESSLRDMVDLMVRLIEACGAVVIMIGAIVAIVKFGQAYANGLRRGAHAPATSGTSTKCS